jgi:hypothetical protein
MRTLYEEIRAQIETAATSIKHVRLWNNQVRLSEEGQQIPFQTPACFIDFPLIQWVQKGKGTQDSRFTVRIYVIFESFHTDENEEDLEVFTVRDEVYMALQDFKPTDAGKLMRITEQTDTNHTNLYTWIIDFETQYLETLAQFPRNSQLATVEELILDTDLVIAESTKEKIRTAGEIPE